VADVGEGAGNGGRDDDPFGRLEELISTERASYDDIKALAEERTRWFQGGTDRRVRLFAFLLLIPIVIVLLYIIVGPTLGWTAEKPDGPLTAWAQGLLATVAGGAAAYLFSTN